MWWELKLAPLLWDDSSTASAGRMVVTADGLNLLTVFPRRSQQAPNRQKCSGILFQMELEEASALMKIDDTEEAIWTWIGCCDKYLELLSCLKSRCSGLKACSSGAYKRTGSFNQLHLCVLLSILKSKLAISDRNVLYGDNIPSTDLHNIYRFSTLLPKALFLSYL